MMAVLCVQACVSIEVAYRSYQWTNIDLDRPTALLLLPDLSSKPAAVLQRH